MVVLKKGSKGSEVKNLQKLLNSSLRPSPKLKENGEFDSDTEEAVKKFQKQSRLKQDGIAGKDTMAALDGESNGKPAKSGEAQKPADAHTSRNSFVGPEVKENPVSKGIIDKIYPYFPKDYTVISAHLTESDVYWKVNYHWDWMRVWLEYAKDHAEMNDEEKKQLNVYYTTLMSNKPSKTGHVKLNKIGKPEDTSSLSTIKKRCGMLQKLKRELKSYASKRQFLKKKMKKKDMLKFAYNKLAMPDKSNHIYGWALDIAGNVADVARIATQLGATRTIEEFPHCHCEFEKPLKLPK
jgi:peptidoglycan hydrolase-like protein with peptidoglycan-binding domain